MTDVHNHTQSSVYLMDPRIFYADGKIFKSKKGPEVDPAHQIQGKPGRELSQEVLTPGDVLNPPPILECISASCSWLDRDVLRGLFLPR